MAKKDKKLKNVLDATVFCNVSGEQVSTKFKGIPSGIDAAMIGILSDLSEHRGIDPANLAQIYASGAKLIQTMEKSDKIKNVLNEVD